MQTGITGQPEQRFRSRREGQRWSIPRWQREKSYLTGSAGSKRASARVISTVVVHEGEARRVRPRLRDSLWTWTSTGTNRPLGRTPSWAHRPRSTPARGRTIQRGKTRGRFTPPPARPTADRV